MVVSPSFRSVLFCLITFSTVGRGEVFATEPTNPEHQYKTEGFEVSLPSAAETKIDKFGPHSIAAAKEYLEGGAIAWVRERGCVNCHTTGPYMAERPGLSMWLGSPNSEVLDNFISDVPSKIQRIVEVERDGHRYYPRSYYSVWRSVGLAEWDKHIRRSLSEATDRSIQDMFERQSDNGSFVTYGEVEIPHVTTDFQLSLQAARAITAAPGWLTGVKSGPLRTKVERLKDWLKNTEPKNDFDRVLRLELYVYMPDLVDDQDHANALKLLSSKQHSDGGWSTRDMSPLEDWHYVISDYVSNLIRQLPDAEQPKSDAYMTALAITLLRQSGVSVNDTRVQRGISWLKKEQRESGRWWMQSLYRGNYHYSTYIATMQAMKALSLCDEL